MNFDFMPELNVRLGYFAVLAAILVILPVPLLPVSEGELV